jgi:hypothetical protein
MTGITEVRGARRACDVPWNRVRERRVLDGAIASWRRRARRMRALELCGAVLMVVLLGRLLLRAAASGDVLEPAEAAAETELEPTPANRPDITRPADSAKRAKNVTSDGFAGTGGHGGARSSGLGGSAGTG